jgi:class 3 adenylate cyclase/tetratricopeptide (TPR) repeat protein
MTFDELLTQVHDLLQRQGRLSYRALKARFQLDDDLLEALKDELIYAQRVAADEDGRVVVWMGESTSSSASGLAPASPQERTPLSYTPAHLAEKIVMSRSALEGERKQVTVLFADLKGSMELLADRDPEEARQLLDPVLERMIEAVHRYEGTVNQVMGDGIMALFGAPIAHEDHAVRACYAALRMQETVTRYGDEMQRSHGVPVQIRVGLNSGEVVVRAIDSSLHMDYTAVGQTTHLAARMEQMARPGSVLTTGETLRLAEGFVQVKALGPVAVRGLVDPVEMFELVGASSTRTRLQAFTARDLTRFVGRQTEVEALCQALERAGSGHGQVVAVIGEPGMGKTRLVYEFIRSHHTRDWLVLESSSVSYGKSTAYLPIRDLFKAYFQLDDRDNGCKIREKLTGKLLTLDASLGPTLPAFLALLDVPAEDRHWQDLDPTQRRQRTLEAIKGLLLRESQVQPLLLVFENLHWIDTETQAALDSLIDSLPTARLLLLVNYRPEYQHGWGNKAYYTQLRLTPLPTASADGLLQALLGDDPSLVPLKQLVIERTEGNPFFLEESVRALIETGGLVGERGAYRLAKPLESMQAPATVQVILAARIDRLPLEEKGLLQTAAVIGHEVSLPLLQAIADLPEEVLHRSLTHLQATELLYETRLFPECAYTFKHALTHEVAYGGLLKERRRALHARIVEALEARAGDRVAEQVERLAHHALRGEVWDKAVTYLRQAAVQAQRTSAHREALTFLEEALEALRHLPKTPETREQAIDVRLDLRGSLYSLGQFEKMLAYLQEAETMAIAISDSRRLGLVFLHSAEYFRQTGRFAEARTLAEQALAVGDKLQDPPVQLYARHYLALACHALGDYRRASELLRAVTQWPPIEWRPSAVGSTVSGSWGAYQAMNFAWLARCLAEIGEFDEGVDAGRRAVTLTADLGSPYNLAASYIGLGYVSLIRGDLDAAGPVLERACSVTREANLTLLRPQATRFLGSAYLLAGRIDEGIALVQAAAEEVESRQLLMQQAAMLALLGEACLCADCVDEASTAAQWALSLATERGQRGDAAAAMYVLGDIAAHRTPPEIEPAAHYYRQALALAEALGMRPLQAHCHLGLGTLHANAGQRLQARAELSAAIAMYRTMDMTFWLPQAEMALAQVV